MKRSYLTKVCFGLVLLLKQVARVVAYCWPRNRQLVAIGAWEGNRFADSPKIFAQYLLENSDLNVVWIGKKQIRSKLPRHERLKFVEKDTFGAMITLLRAKTWVCCISIEWDLTSWPIEGFATLINTYHSFGMKASGNSTGIGRRNAVKCSLLGKIATKLSRHRRPWALVGGECDVENLSNGNTAYFCKERVLRIGTPSNDYLIGNKDNKHLINDIKQRMAKTLGFDASKKVISYLPTWRNPGVRVRSFYGLDDNSKRRWEEMLDRHNAVLIEKHHPRTLKEYPVVGDSFCSIPISAEQAQNVDVHDLLLISDIHISDYSGSIQDYGVLGRPCIYFVYDLDDYVTNCSGLVAGWENRFAGKTVRTDDELYVEVERNLEDPVFEPDQGFLHTIEYQGGLSCQRLLQFILEQ